MISNTSKLNVCDNSGILRVKCFKTNNKTSVTLGSVIYTSVKLRKPKTKLVKLNIVKGIIVRLTKNVSRNIGFYFVFSSNDIVLFNDKNEPLGTRIFGPLPLELRKKKFLKLLSLGSTFI